MHAVIDKEIAYKMDDKEFSSASGTTTTNTEPGQQTSAQAEQPPAAEKGIIVVSLIYIIEVHAKLINIIITLSNYLEQRLFIKHNTLI